MPAAYWTDFRGPNRDGDYREGPVRVDWPAGGLTPIWKQPAGAGYASFVIARNRAFTIEQRGPNEVVAAYDVAYGSRVVDQRVAGGIPRVDGRRRPARDADMVRRPPLSRSAPPASFAPWTREAGR